VPATTTGSSGKSSALRYVALAAAAGSLYVTYRVARRLYTVFTYSNPAALIEHGCVPSDGDEWDHRPLLLEPTLEMLRALGAHEQLAPLAERGSLLVVQPATWVRLIAGGAVPGAFPKEAVAVVEAAAEQLPGGEERQLDWVRTSADVRSCVHVGAPPTIILIGTSHVSKKSAEEVEQAVQVCWEPLWLGQQEQCAALCFLSAVFESFPTKLQPPCNQIIRPDLLFLELDPARAGLMYR